MEAAFPDGLRMEEALAKIDGSLGWTVTLCSGACMFVGYIENEVAQEIFSDEQVCFAGSGHASGIASCKSDGYIVNGYWNYATGAPYATIFTANCKIEKNGNPVIDDNGEQKILSFFFKRNEVEIDADWDTMGLKATAGFSFRVTNLFVHTNRTFIIDAAHATIKAPIYQYPFIQFAEATLAVNSLGMANHFLEEAHHILQKSNIINNVKKAMLQDLQAANETLASLKNNFYAAVDESWNEQIAGKELSKEKLQCVSNTSRYLAKEIKTIVALLYPYCGLSKTKTSSTINRIFRDIFTASQHRLLNLPDSLLHTNVT